MLIASILAFTSIKPGKAKADNPVSYFVQSASAQTTNDSLPASVVVGNDTIQNPANNSGTVILTDQIKGYFTSLGSVAFLTLIVCAFIKLKTKLSGGAMGAISWIVGMGLAFVGYGMHWGMFEHATILQTVIAGGLSSLIANNIADGGLVQGLYNTFLDRKTS